MTETASAWETIHRTDGIPQLEKTFKFADWAAAMRFAQGVSEAAEAADHHPELVITWGRVTVRWWSHDAGGVTDRDHALAASCDALAAP